MVNIYESCSLAELAHKFSDALAAEKDNPLSGPWVIVQNNEIKEWLSLRIASRQGIAGNFNYIFPSEFLWMLHRLYIDDIPQVLPSDLNSMQWALFELFSSKPELMEQIPFYNSGAADTPQKRFQLSGQVADNFDQYQVYRPGMMENWLHRKLVTKDPNEGWQLSIWNQLNQVWGNNEKTKKIPTRSGAYTELLKWLDNPKHPLWDKLPDNIYVFGLSHISKPFLEIISRIGNRKQIHLFTLQKPEYELTEPLNELISVWGKTSAEQKLLIEDTLMKHDVQARKHDLQTSSPVTFPKLKVHSCHNVRREVQVLKDEVLHYLDQNPDSKASDILIMVPDADTYSGILEIIFEGEEGEPALPISRISGQNYHSAEDVMAELLELLSSDFKAGDVIQFLNQDPVKAKFSFTDADIELLEEWVHDNGIYRGIGDDFNSKYSWQKGSSQLLSGFIMETAPLDIFRGIAPYNRISSTDEALLSARFSHFVYTLKNAAEWVSTSKEPSDWITLISRLIDDFFDDAGGSKVQTALLKKLVDKLKQQSLFTAFTKEVSFGLMKNWLIKQLSTHNSSSGRFGQGITVSSYIPYRSIPFHFIAMMGMNESVFPRKAVRPEFDLIYADPKPGDRILKEDDTYLFLETIQAARDQLHISYIGQDQHTDSIRLPSILVQQLLDVFYDSQKEGIIRHSLHPFNKKYFKSGKPSSYSDKNKSISVKMEKEREGLQSPFIKDKFKLIENETDHQLQISELLSYFKNPSKYLLQNELGVSSYDEFREVIDRESFKLDNLERYKLDHLLFETLRKGEAVDKVEEYANLTAMVPEALAGKKVFRKEKESISALIQHIKIYTEAEESEQEVSIQIGDTSLYGTIHGLYDNLLFSYRVGQRRAEHELEHWLRHLILLESGYELQKSVHLSKDGTDVDILEIESVNIPKNPLSSYLEWFLSNSDVLQKSAFFPQSSKAYAEALFEGKDDKEGIKKARSKWEVSPHKSYAEEADYYNSLLWRGYDPIESRAFRENALKFWEPFFQAQKESEK